MKNGLAVIALIVWCLYLGATFISRKAFEPTSASKESVYDRVMRTKTLRCAYLITPVYLVKDPNTGAFSGIYYDVIQQMGKDLGLKIDWVEEVGAANMYEGFKTGRADALCSASTSTPSRSLAADFSNPIGFGPLYLYTRAGDTRFDGAYEKANDKSLTAITFDGYYGAAITKDEFPSAKLISLPNLSGEIDILQEVASGKADFAVCGALTAHEFMKKNPGKLRQVVGLPIRFPRYIFALPLGEERLKAMFNTVLTFYQETGFLDKGLD